MGESGICLLLMAGPGGETEPERMVADIRRAAACDTLEKALAISAITQIIVATPDQDLVTAVEGLSLSAPVCTRPVPEAQQPVPEAQRRVRVSAAKGEGVAQAQLIVDFDPPGQPFHFGHRLLDLIAKYRLEKVLYMGAGSGVLLSADELAGMACNLARMEAGVITNNLYSSDFVAFAPASALTTMPPVAVDNDLAWRLATDGHLPATSLPRGAATQLDVDTPTDLMILTLHRGTGPRTRQALEKIPLEVGPLKEILSILTDPAAETLVAGRVGAATWRYLEEATACRTRLIAEERGMVASGRWARGEVRSLLGYYLEQVGPQRFFATLGEVSQAAILDTRVLMAHAGRWPPAADRFYSDLRQPAQIHDNWLSAFTAAAVQASIPVILGGHSLVSGGLYALVEAAGLGPP
jgi:CTP:molybdopterin cytidylyltransferase MocA